MRWLKSTLTLGLMIAAGVVAVSALFSDHSNDYGAVTLPAGGIIHLPEGTATVYQHEGASVGFQVIPVAGGAPVPIKSAGGTIAANGVQRSEVIGEHGAIAKLDAPADGNYRVVSDVQVAPAASLSFGTNAATAIAAKWKLLAGLVLAAFLIALIPTPRHTRRSHDGPTGEASTAPPSIPPRAPYAG